MSVQITEARNIEDPKPHLVYVMLVNYEGSEPWSVERRFSAFVELRELLSKSLQELPTLPRKTWTKNSKNQGFMTQRQKGLATFMNEICQIRYAVQSPEFGKFLEVEKHAIIRTIKPIVIKTIADPQFGVNDFLYEEEVGIMFTVCEDTHSVSRLDSQISNIKIPGKESDDFQPIGSFNCWKLDDERAWKMTCTLFFDCAATVLAWESERRYAIVGLESGLIAMYFTENLETFTLVYELQVHTDRVTGLIYNNTRDILISCARDKKFNIYDLRKERSLATVNVGKSWLSALEYDEEANYVFLGTYGQEILMYDISPNPPILVHTLKGHTGSVRCLYYKPSERYLFSGGFDWVGGIWTIENAGSINRSRSIGWLKGGPKKKMKSIVYCSSPRQVICGYEDGRLSIWDTESGTLRSVIHGHSGAIIQLKWLDGPGVLLSGSLDGNVKFWKFQTQGRNGERTLKLKDGAEVGRI